MTEMTMSHADAVRRWRWVRAGLRVERVGLRLALGVACVSGLLMLILDRSDRGLPMVIFCGGQLLLAITQVAALALSTVGPDSETRRQARRTGWLVVAAAVLLIVMFATAIWPARLGSLRDAVRAQIITVAFVSLLADVAVLGYLWLGIHAALGRECDDPQLAFYADRFADVWGVLSACAGFLIVWELRRLPLSAIDPFQSLLAVTIITILEAVYLMLVERSRRVVAT